MVDVRIWKWNELSPDLKQKLLSRSEDDIASVLESIQGILDEVKTKGDKALLHYNHLFDKAPEDMNLLVSEDEYKEAEKSLSPELKKAIDTAVSNVWKFHRGQLPEGLSMNQIDNGVLAGERATAIDSVGLYVPRKRGSFPSMLYMLAVPAKIAGVPHIALCTPPDADGKADAACLYTAKICGVDAVFKVGGAHAIGAMAYGTETVKPVLKLAGPGSKYVAAAKALLHGVVDTGMPAGPSESMILADSSADPEKLVLDLLIEAEHGSDSAAVLVTDSADLAEKVKSGIEDIWSSIPEPRKGFISDVFKGYGGIILCGDMKEGAGIINDFAPEHLQIVTKDPWQSQSLIRNAGEILLGQNTPFSLANYAVGANAVLPTGAKAKTYSAISVRDFIKYISVVYLSKEGFDTLKDPVTILADYEDFPMHARALKDRKA